MQRLLKAYIIKLANKKLDMIKIQIKKKVEKIDTYNLLKNNDVEIKELPLKLLIVKGKR